MAHMAGNEPNFDISSKKYDVQKTVPQKYKTAWAQGLKTDGKNLKISISLFKSKTPSQKWLRNFVLT